MEWRKKGAALGAGPRESVVPLDLGEAAAINDDKADVEIEEDEENDDDDVYDEKQQ